MSEYSEAAGDFFIFEAPFNYHLLVGSQLTTSYFERSQPGESLCEMVIVHRVEIAILDIEFLQLQVLLAGYLFK